MREGIASQFLARIVNWSAHATRRRRLLTSGVCIVGVFLLFSQVGQGAVLETFQADFARESSSGVKGEILRGRVSFEASAGRLLVEVSGPVHQWMVLQGKETLLYYPEQQQAFRMISKTDTSMPFFKVIWSCFKEDFDLARQGFKMARYEKKGTTLLSIWTPPANLSKLVGEATLEYDGNKLMRVEHKTAHGNMLSRAVFRQHTVFGGYAFPLEVAISYGSKQGVTDERVVYSNPRFNTPLPAVVRDFKIPAGIKVQDIEW